MWNSSTEHYDKQNQFQYLINKKVTETSNVFSGTNFMQNVKQKVQMSVLDRNETPGVLLLQTTQTLYLGVLIFTNL